MSDEKQQSGPNVAAGEVEVSGFVKIIDKDGNLKAELPITTIEINEDIKNAVIDDSA